MAGRGATICAFLRLAVAAITEDIWPMNYTAAYNIFGTVPAVEDLQLTLEPGSKVPSWLSGAYYISGSGQYEWGDEAYNGWMDGPATISRVTIKDGENLSFDRKYIESTTYKQNKEAGEIVITELTTYGEPSDLIGPRTPAAIAAVDRLEYYMTHLSDNTVIKTEELYGYLISFSETPSFNVIDKDTLETVGTYDINKGPNMPDHTICATQTAHGFVDEDTGTFWNTVMCFSSPPHGLVPKTYFYIQKWNNIFEKINPGDIMDHIEYGEGIQSLEKNDIHPDDPYPDYIGYFHQAAMTKDYFIMPFISVQMNSPTCIAGSVSQGKPYFDCIQDNENLDGIFVVFRKTDMKEVARFRTDYYLLMHIINSFQVSENEIHIDAMLVGIKGHTPFDLFTVDIINATGQQYIDNYFNTLMQVRPGKVVLDLTAPTGDFNLKPVKNRMFFDEATDNDEWKCYMTAGSDFPQTRPDDWLQSNYDVFYSHGLGMLYVDRIYRTQLSTLDRKIWFEPGHAVFEVGVALSPDRSETVIMSLAAPLVVTEETPAVFMIFLDGDTMAELGRAYFPGGFRFVISAHTTFLQNEASETTTTATKTDSPTPVVPADTTTQSGSGFTSSISYLTLLMCSYLSL